jgi:hypothetical protein
VNDRIAISASPPHRGKIRNIPAMALDAEALKRLVRAPAQGAHRPTLRNQPADNCAPDEAGSSGHQNSATSSAAHVSLAAAH